MINISRIPVVVKNSRLPTVDESKITLSAEYESSAVAHWVLGVDAGSLLSKVGTAQLSVVGAVTYTANGVETVGSAGYLLSDIVDFDDSMTVVMVIKMPTVSTKNYPLLSNFQSSPTRGILSTISANDSFAKIFVSSDGDHPAAITTAAPALPGEYVALVVTKDYAGSPPRVAIHGADEYAEDTTGFIGTDDVIGTEPVAFGWSSTLSASYTEDGVEFCEVIIFDKKMTKTQMADVAYRARIRGLKRGLGVLA